MTFFYKGFARYVSGAKIDWVGLSEKYDYSYKYSVSGTA